MIVWGANSHFGYNRNLLEPGDNMMPMGQYLKDRYEKSMYSVALTSYDGLSGSIYRDTITAVPPATDDCIEKILADAGMEYGFINLRAKKAKKCLKDPVKARLYGYGNHMGEWPKMADGLLFIKTMEPNAARKNPAEITKIND